MKEMGYDVDKAVGMNGGDFLIDVVNVDDRSLEAERESWKRVFGIVEGWEGRRGEFERREVERLKLQHERSRTASVVPSGNGNGNTGEKVLLDEVVEVEETDYDISNLSAGFMEQTVVLTRRVFANMIEDRLTLWGSMVEVLMMSIVMGAIFWHVDETPAGIVSRKSLLYTVCALQNYLGLMFITWKLSNEMKVFDRERADKMYGVPAYLSAWFIVNTVLYAALATLFAVIIYFMVGLRSDDLGYHLGIFILANILMQMVTLSFGYVCVAFNRDFAGASLIGIPIYLRWFQHIGFITYGLRLISANEFSGRIFECPGLPKGLPSCNGDDVLSLAGFKSWDINMPILALILNFVIFVGVAGIVLHFFGNSGTKAAARVKPSSTVKSKKDEQQPNDADEIEMGEHGGKKSDGSYRLRPPKITLRLEKSSLVFRRRVDFWSNPLEYAMTRISGNQKTSSSSYSSKQNYIDTHILRQVSATFHPGQITAIFGASGAGKSTLLQLLHSRTSSNLPPSTTSIISGKMYHNNLELKADQVSGITASVRQDDSHLLPALTARETLLYAAFLRLPVEWDKERKVNRADEVLVELGLKTCANTLVGGNGVKGLSGGEKRRLSVGLAMLTDPAILLLDEPTSGLDAATARNMMITLKKIAAQGRTVICSIHQPRSDIVPIIDQILLLARGGRVVYQGPTMHMLPYFATLGHPCPPLTNPADFALDISSVDLRGHDVEGVSRARVERLVKAWAEDSEVLMKSELGKAISQGDIDGEKAVVDSIEVVKSDNDGAGVGFSSGSGAPHIYASSGEISIATYTKAVKRLPQPGLMASRIMQVVAYAVILAMYFSRLGHDQASVTSRIGLFQQVGALIFIGMLNNLSVFPQELALFRYERQDGSYSVDSFFWTYTVNEMPFEIIGSLIFGVLAYFAIGVQVNLFVMAFVSFAYVSAGESIGLSFCSFISQPGFSVQIMSALISIMSIMQGFLSINMPVFLSAVNYASMARWSARATAALEFDSLAFSCPTITTANGTIDAPTCMYHTGDDVLSLFGFPSGYYAFYTSILGTFVCLVVYRAAAYAVMKWRL
ncbi:hypothetical protein HDU76_002431 [Blyttiomyces sp. JEL0837]|nr:hypothetical protein HDU76_002431 [Blyttiomyces sp. JEL0837]